MKKGNGFTLIELLAVIIILAVIALIATPVVLNVVEKAKKSAAESSIAGYADAIKLAQYEYMFSNDGALPANFSTLIAGYTVTVSGQNPKCGQDVSGSPNGTVTLSNGVVTIASCELDGYTCSFEEGTASCSKP